MSCCHKKGIGDRRGQVWAWMVDLAQLPGQQTIYLFDIVASLCAGFNEHDIEFLSSLLALLRGDLSAQRGTDGRTDRYGKKFEDTGGKRERGRKRRNCLGDIKEVSSVKKKTQRKREVAVWPSKDEAGQTLETARPLSRIICGPLQCTNLFDVIASLGAGLYVHHIELASFPLCRLYRDLPATVPGEGGERWWEEKGGGEGVCEG